MTIAPVRGFNGYGGPKQMHSALTSMTPQTAIEPRPYWATRAPRTNCPRRYHDNTGVRLYPIPAPDGNGFLAVPGVTSILSFTDSNEDKQRLKDWREREVAAGRDPNAARERGTRVHNMLESWLRTGSVHTEDTNLEDLAFFSGMTQHLEAFDEHLWSERPLRNGWDHVWSAPVGNPHRLARVWSAQWGFAGTPDLIARRRRDVLVLADFKTSTQPYYRPTGGRVPRHKAYSYRKFMKTVRQLCAYRLAIQETLDLDVNHFQIIVGLPEPNKAQSFFVEGTIIQKETERFKQQAVKFWQAYQPNLKPLEQTAAPALAA